MALDSQSDSDSLIPLSQGFTKRRLSQTSLEQPIVVNPTELEEILSRVVSKQVCDKMVRLENSINRMMNHIEAVACGEAEDAALRVTTDMGAADIAIAGVSLPHDDYYVYTTGMLSDKLGLGSKNLHPVKMLIKELDLKGNPDYHRQIITGTSTTSFVHKYSENAFLLLKAELAKHNSNIAS
ncbi:MAG: hypothetical protein RLZZ511_3639 [Cyanobacteriota bacterium]|jgi:hypothetical protein